MRAALQFCLALLSIAAALYVAGADPVLCAGLAGPVALSFVAALIDAAREADEWRLVEGWRETAKDIDRRLDEIAVEYGLARG